MNIEDKQVLLFSAGRTGSTLIWQCLKELFNNPIKAHPKEMRQHFAKKNMDCVITERDPIESYLSFVRCTVLKGDPNGFKKKINEKSYLFSECLNYKNDLQYISRIKKEYSGRILNLDYSKFNNNYNYIFSNFESFFNIKIKEYQKQKIINKTSKSTNKKTQSKFKNFNSHDTESLIHGLHIVSDCDNYYSQMLTKENLEMLKNFFNE